MRCSKSCYLYDLELVDLFEDTVIEQVYCFISYADGAALKTLADLLRAL